MTATAKPNRRRMPRRWWYFMLFDLVARWWPVRRERRGVLVIRVDGIGDMVLFQPAFRHYAEVFGVDPSEVTLLGCDSWKALAADLFPGCRFRSFDERAYVRRPFYRLKVSLWVRRQGFAVVTCDSYLRRPLINDALVYVSGAPRRIVAKPYISAKTAAVFAWYLARCQQVIDTGAYPDHEIDRHFRFLSQLAGRTIPPEPPRFGWSAPPEVTVPGRYAVLNVGANEPGRRWPFAAFLKLADDLARRGLTVAFVGGPAEAACKAELAAADREGRFLDLIGRISLRGLMTLLRDAAVVVTNETGPAHLAIGLGAPTVMILGGGQYGAWAPFPPSVAQPQVRFAAEPMPCFNCLWLCTVPHPPGSAYPCVALVRREAVLADVAAVLGTA